jgi:hypothetical protein
MRGKRELLVAVLLCGIALTFAQENEVKIKPSGFAYYQIGQIEQMTPQDASLITKAFDQHFNGRLTLEAQVQEHLRIIIGVEGDLAANLSQDMSLKKLFLLKEAQGIYSYGNQTSVFLEFTTGYFPFKYNPEARNLGEYLFRTGAYPGYIITDFDFAKARLMGMNLSAVLLNDIKLNVLFTTEYTEAPYFDYSLSFVGGYRTLQNMIDIGAGINFNRLIPIRPNVTTDHTNKVTDSLGNIVIENGDTLYYTKKGIKVMGRITVDPKPLLPFADMMGSEDLKLYGEFAILGLKNYGTYFPELSKRIPMMFGVHIPCFKIMDVLASEFEYYNTDKERLLNIPTEANKVTPDNYPVGQARSLWKWSIFGQKTIIKGWAVKGLIGRDHYRSYNNVGNYDAIERMNGPGDWHYKLRLMYSF